MPSLETVTPTPKQTVHTPTPAATGGLAQFLALCSDTAEFYNDHPATRYSTSLFLHSDGSLGSEMVLRAPFPHRAPSVPIFPIAFFCGDFPNGLPICSDTLEQAYRHADRLRIQTAQGHHQRGEYAR
jgi:hypothetical protein